MKSVGYKIRIPYIFILKNDETMAIPSFILSTICACALLTFIPQLTPLWSLCATAKLS